MAHGWGGQVAKEDDEDRSTLTIAKHPQLIGTGWGGLSAPFHQIVLEFLPSDDHTRLIVDVQAQPRLAPFIIAGSGAWLFAGLAIRQSQLDLAAWMVLGPIFLFLAVVGSSLLSLRSALRGQILRSGGTIETTHLYWSLGRKSAFPPSQF